MPEPTHRQFTRGRILAWLYLPLSTALLLVGCGGSSEPILEVTLRINGAVATVAPLRQGDEATFEVASGSIVELEASEAVDWDSEVGDGASADSPSETDTHKRFVLVRAGVAATSSRFTARTKAMPAREVNVTLTMPPAEFASRARVAGEFARWESTYTPAGGQARDDTSRDDVTQVTPEAIALVVTSRAVDGRPTAYRQFDAQGHTVSFAQVGYDEEGNDYPSSCSFDPPVVDFDYPLWLGKTWEAAWHTTHCIDAAEGGGSLSAAVEAYESVTVPAGTFDALRIRTRMTPDEPGAGGFARNVSVCWWSVELRRNVKCDTQLLDAATGQGVRHGADAPARDRRTRAALIEARHGAAAKDSMREAGCCRRCRRLRASPPSRRGSTAHCCQRPRSGEVRYSPVADRDA